MGAKGEWPQGKNEQGRGVWSSRLRNIETTANIAVAEPPQHRKMPAVTWKVIVKFLSLVAAHNMRRNVIKDWSVHDARRKNGCE